VAYEVLRDEASGSGDGAARLVNGERDFDEAVAPRFHRLIPI
jgi:hypothetical protein